MEKTIAQPLIDHITEAKKKAVTAMKGGDVKAAKRAITCDGDLRQLARIEKRLAAKFYDGEVAK